MSDINATFADNSEMSSSYAPEVITVTYTKKEKSKTIKFNSFEDLAKLKELDAEKDSV